MTRCEETPYGRGSVQAMASKKKSGQTKTPGKSAKAHMEMPPKEIAPGGDIQGHQRGEVGQFTDKGAPGLQKR